MSTVCAIKKNGKIYIGADTQTTRGENKIHYLGEESRKIRVLDNGIVLGAVGPVLGSTLIFSHPEFFTLPKSRKLTKQYVSEVIVPRIDACLDDYDMIDAKKNKAPTWKNDFVIAHKDRLFWLCGKGAVVTIEHFVSIGSGSEVAYPELLRLDRADVHSDEEVLEGLTRGLRAAAERKTSVGAPFYLTDTKSKQFKLIQ